MGIDDDGQDTDAFEQGSRVEAAQDREPGREPGDGKGCRCGADPSGGSGRRSACRPEPVPGNEYFGSSECDALDLRLDGRGDLAGVPFNDPNPGHCSGSGGPAVGDGDADPVEIGPLFASRSLYLTLALFFDYPQDPLFPRLVARLAGIDIKCVARSLGNLSTLRVIRPCREWGETGYRLNRAHPLFAELRSIFAKTRRRRRHEIPARAGSDPL